MGESCEMPDWEFAKIDEDLYSLVSEILGLKDEINEDPDLFNWYCNLRDNLCLKIQEQRGRVRF